LGINGTENTLKPPPVIGQKATGIRDFLTARICKYPNFCAVEQHWLLLVIVRCKNLLQKFCCFAGLLHTGRRGHRHRLRACRKILLVSWGLDGMLRFWSFDGKAIGGSVTRTHGGGVPGVLVEVDRLRGVLALSDRLVSWGRDGAVRFWSFGGRPITPPWFPPSEYPEWISVLNGALWCGLLGKLFRLELPPVALKPNATPERNFYR
jgi:hypothetical protein